MLSLREKETNRGFTWPIGTVVYSLEDTPPQGVLPMDGQYLDPTDLRYRALYRVIGFRFGKNAEGHFRIPKLEDYLSVLNPTASGIDANATPFVTKGPYVRQHEHSNGYTGSGGSHAHSKSFIKVEDIAGQAGTNGKGDLTCGSGSTSISLGSCGNHGHPVSQGTYEGVANWRPQSLMTRVYIVAGGSNA